MLLLGIDLGTSSIKVSVVDSQTQECKASASYPDTETAILAPRPGWAEQEPDQWWHNVQQAILACHQLNKYDPKDISAIGIAYQMHGLVLVDKMQNVLRPAIIWCDSRAVAIGEKAFHSIGEEKCLQQLLNSPGNFTASKLAWVKEKEPGIYSKIDKVLLPGDFIALRLTGEATTTISALSEGIFWDFKRNEISKDILDHFGFDQSFFPSIRKLFSSHGQLKNDVAIGLALIPGIPVSYKAGDQPNNALSLNVMEPGEVGGTAGTSGVIYGVSDQLCYDNESRINSFAHVNHSQEDNRIGVLLCINGVGIFNRWMRDLIGNNGETYSTLNELASKVEPGSAGLLAFPFGNGAERMLNNKQAGGHFHYLDFNVHGKGHMIRAVQEGIAFAFRYGLDIMRENGMTPSVVRAAKSNLFLSSVFTDTFTAINNVAVEFYEGDGSFGAAIGAGIGAGMYDSAKTAAAMRKPISISQPNDIPGIQSRYSEWKEQLSAHLNK